MAETPRRNTVEENANWDLGGGEGEKISRREQAETGRRQPEFGCQRLCGQRADCAKQVRQVVAEREGQEDAEDER